VNETGIQTKLPASIRDKGQYAMASGVVALMLYVAGFPIFLLFFVGVLTFFIWKVFSSEGRNETRRIFEFYLSANEILRDDERRWYGFEIQEAIARGEAIARSMTATPPLVCFSLGALYGRLNDHASVVKYLSRVVEDAAAEELSVVYPSKDLRDYVRMLRKIERAPAEAPQTSKAIRSLERARKNRAKDLLEQSRSELSQIARERPQIEQNLESVANIGGLRDSQAETGNPQPEFREAVSAVVSTSSLERGHSVTRRKVSTHDLETAPAERQTISEVLHDIYDRNA